MSMSNGLMDLLGDPETQSYLDSTEEYIRADALNIKLKTNDDEN